MTATRMTIEKARFNMIEQQIRPWGVLDPMVLDLLAVVRREAFVPEAYRELAFADVEIPIGSGQTMLAPKIEARMLQELALQKTDSVLEIGTGSGFMAALLAARAEYVHSVEIDPGLAQTARRNLLETGVANVLVETGDGALGWPHHAPYDAIVFSGSMPALPAGVLQQLKIGGRLVAVVGEAPAMQLQLITRVADEAFNTLAVLETVIAPLSNAPRSPVFIF